MNITQMLQATSTTANQQRVESQKDNKKFDLGAYAISKKDKNDGGQMQRERENPELNRELNREINKAFLDKASNNDNIQRYKESVAKFRNSIKVAFSDEIKDDYKIRNGYVPLDWNA